MIYASNLGLHTTDVMLTTLVCSFLLHFLILSCISV